MSKQSKIIIGIILVMVLVLGVTTYLGKEDLALRTELNNDAIFTVTEGGETLATYNMSEIQDMGEVSFKANLKTNGQAPIEYTYQGVLLKSILENAGASFDDKNSAIVSAVDGYVVSVSMEKLMDDENVYLAYMREGDLIGTYEDGGRGPYMVIISKDKFSQYWCKFAHSVELQ